MMKGATIRVTSGPSGVGGVGSVGGVGDSDSAATLAQWNALYDAEQVVCCQKERISAKLSSHLRCLHICFRMNINFGIGVNKAKKLSTPEELR